MSVEKFVAWASKIVLDTGEEWVVEPWQKAIVADILSGKPANWVVVPEGNGKTTLMAGLALFHLDPDGWGRDQPFVVVAAATREQAEWLYLQAEGMVYATPGMPDKFKCLSGFRRINRKDAFGRIQIFAADDRTADGAIFTLGIVDELHNHRDLRLWRRWHGKLAKRGGQLVAISTAGQPGSEFEEARAKILREADKVEENGAHVRAEDENIILNDWAVRDRKNVGDMKAVAAANPREALTPEVLFQKSPEKDKTVTIEHFMRFCCNIATRIEGSGILPEDWEACLESELVPDMDAQFVGGMDLGFSQDCTGLVVIGWEGFDRRVIAWSHILKPPVKERDIVRALCEAQERFSPVVWAFDKSRSGAQMAQQLENHEHPHQGDTTFDFKEYMMTNTPMSLAAARLDEAIRSRWIRHDGDPDLRQHVLNAVKKETGSGRWRYERPVETAGGRPGGGGKRFPIDALTALSIAHSVAVDEFAKADVQPMVAFA